jgi:hypothetical protein
MKIYLYIYTHIPVNTHIFFILNQGISLRQHCQVFATCLSVRAPSLPRGGGWGHYKNIILLSSSAVIMLVSSLGDFGFIHHSPASGSEIVFHMSTILDSCIILSSCFSLIIIPVLYFGSLMLSYSILYSLFYCFFLTALPNSHVLHY